MQFAAAVAIPAIVVGIAVDQCWTRLNKAKTEQQARRFQIISGSYFTFDDHEPGTGATQTHGLFKVDTMTGRVWEYRDSIIHPSGGVQIITQWIELKDETTDSKKF